MIKNRLRLPIFGKSINRVIRTKSSISKRAYLLNKDYGTQQFKKYVLEKNMTSTGQNESRVRVDSINNSLNLNLNPDMMRSAGLN